MACRRETGTATKEYEDYFKEEDDSKRTGNYTDVVNKYYDLATSFYEYGWGESFHFAAREIGESFEASIIRQETGTSPPEPRARRFSPRARLAPAGGANVRWFSPCPENDPRRRYRRRASLFSRFPRPDLLTFFFP